MLGVTICKLLVILLAGFTVALPLSRYEPTPSLTRRAPAVDVWLSGQKDEQSGRSSTTGQNSPVATNSIFAHDQWEERDVHEKRWTIALAFPQATPVDAVSPRGKSLTRQIADDSLVLDILEDRQRGSKGELDVGRRKVTDPSFFAKAQWEDSDSAP